jgi:hypothetical protein
MLRIPNRRNLLQSPAHFDLSIMTTSEKRFGLVDSRKGLDGKDISCEEEDWDQASTNTIYVYFYLRLQGVTELLTWCKLPLSVSLFPNLSFNLTKCFILYVTTKIPLPNTYVIILVLKYLENLNRNKLIKMHYKHDSNEEYDHRNPKIHNLWTLYI